MADLKEVQELACERYVNAKDAKEQEAAIQALKVASDSIIAETKVDDAGFEAQEKLKTEKIGLILTAAGIGVNLLVGVVTAVVGLRSTKYKCSTSLAQTASILAFNAEDHVVTTKDAMKFIVQPK